MILINSTVKVFLAVVKYGTASEAGKQIGLTQTAVTQRIQSLERDIGFSLFTRSKSGMKLTDEGTLVYRHCTSVTEIDGQLQAQIRQLGVMQDIELNFTSMSSVLSGRVVPQISEVIKKWPRMNINFHIESHDRRLQLLKSGKADIAIMNSFELTPELETKELLPLELKLVAPSSWKGRKLKEILKNEKMLTYSQDDMHSKHYLEMYDLLQHLKTKRIHTNENRTFQAQIEHGFGFGLLPLELAKPSLEGGKLILLNSGKSIKLPISLAWYKRVEMPSYMDEIIEAIN